LTGFLMWTRLILKRIF